MQKHGAPLLICLAMALLGWAQEPTTAPSPSAPPAVPGPTIRVTSTEVLLDLAVRDKRGRPVKNLKPSDVEIYEDGVRQQVLSFRLAGTRETQRREAVAEVKPEPGKSVSKPLREVNVVCIVFHNLDPVSRNQAMEAVQEFIKNDLPQETYVGVFSLSDRLTPVYPFTNNHDELIQAARNAFNGKPLDFAMASEAILTANPTQATVSVAISGAGRGSSASATMRVTGGEISKSAITGADVSNSTGANALRGDQVRERGDFGNITGMRETDKIITMIKELGTLPGHKTVLLVTTGLMTTGDPERFESILNNANRAGITVYALDTTGLSSTNDTVQAGNNALGRVAAVSRTQGATNSSLSAMREKSRQNDNTNDAVRTSDLQASLRALSEGTGGFLIANTHDYRKPFQRLIDDLEAHYEAVYRPTSDKYDGHLRKIEVKLARSDLQVDSRTGYFAMPDLKDSGPLAPEETTALAVLNAKPLPHAFDFRSTSFHFQSDGSSQSALAFALPGTSLTATPDPARQTHKFHLSLLALVKDAGGQVVDKYKVDMPYEVPDANLAAVRASALTYTHPVNLTPGSYAVETVVLDREGRQASTSMLEMEIPKPAKSIGLSSLILVQQLEPPPGQPNESDPLIFKGKRLVPQLDATVDAARKRYVYFVVYPDKTIAEKPKIQVEFRAGGEVFGSQTVDLPAPDASGAIPMFVAAATRPGACELRITAVQGNQSTTENFNYTVSVN